MTISLYHDSHLPREAEIINRVQESPTIFTLHIRFVDEESQKKFSYHPGQFNMVYLYGVGEVAISILSDPRENHVLSHTIRAVGRVTKALQTLKKGDRIGIRGPFGRGWPLEQSKGKNIVIMTGGLGCAPTVSVINYVLARRDEYANLIIMQGVKNTDDFIFRKQYEKWQEFPSTEIYIAADQAGPKWPWGVGYVTDMIKAIDLSPANTIVMMCGPEIMMQTAINAFIKRRLPEENIYLSMERNMECGIGQCGHCQLGGFFICKDGPVFHYPQIKTLLFKEGF